MLDDAQLQAVWDRYGKHTKSEDHREGFQQWWGAYRKHVSAVQAASAEELATPQWQERLWTDKSITPVGPGDSIDVSVLYADAQVVDAIVGIVHTQWPTSVNERAKAIQRTFAELLDLVATKDVRRRPAAKLKRIFVALLPRDLTCVMSYQPNQDAASLLLPPDYRHGHLGLHVLMRQRLRDVLGPEQSLDDDIERSCFCWWLHENHAGLSDKGGVLGLFAKDVGGQIGLPALELWSFGKQYKAVAAIGGLDATYRAIVQNAQSKVSRDDLVEMLVTEEGFGNLQPKSIRQIITGVKGLGFLEEDGGLLVPTRAGEELLEDEQADVLVEALLQRVYGYAQLLRLLMTTPERWISR